MAPPAKLLVILDDNILNEFPNTSFSYTLAVTAKSVIDEVAAILNVDCNELILAVILVAVAVAVDPVVT